MYLNSSTWTNSFHLRSTRSFRLFVPRIFEKLESCELSKSSGIDYSLITLLQIPPVDHCRYIYIYIYKILLVTAAQKVRKHPRWKRGVVEENGTPVATSSNPWNGEEQKGSRPVSGFQKVTITRWDPYEATAMHNIIHRFPLLSPCRYTWIRFVYTGGIYGKIYVGRRSPGPVCPLVAILSSCLYLASLNFRPERWKKLPIVAQSTDIFPPFFFPPFPPPVFLSFSFTFFPPPLFSFLLLFVCIVFSKPLANGSGWVISLGFHDNAEC